MNNKKVLFCAILLIGICIGVISGAISYLSYTTDEGVVNTFVAAGGGQIIDPDIPDDEDDDYNFNLKESKATLKEDRTGYDLDSTNKVLSNVYDAAVPGMVIAKDPRLTVNINDNISAYIFIEILDTTNNNLSYNVTSDWIELTGVIGNNGGKVYTYKNSAYIGVEGMEFYEIQILSDNKVKAANNLYDVDIQTEGMQLGKLELYAYICQSVGFNSATDAFNTVF